MPERASTAEVERFKLPAELKGLANRWAGNAHSAML